MYLGVEALGNVDISGDLEVMNSTPFTSPEGEVGGNPNSQVANPRLQTLGNVGSYGIPQVMSPNTPSVSQPAALSPRGQSFMARVMARKAVAAKAKLSGKPRNTRKLTSRISLTS